MDFADITQPAATATRMDAAWLDAHWMPFTGNRNFKANPRMVVGAQGAYLHDSAGRKIFDGLSGLWCSGLGHGRKEIAEAVGKAALNLDYAPAFQFGHPAAFALANKIKELTPDGLDYVFFTGSGSEAADTSLKMARAYWRTKGQAGKTRLIGREKGYHGVNYGGISVGGLSGNRKMFGQGIEADHLPHTQPATGSFYKGMPDIDGRALADRLLDVIALHDASTIAAVIVEPFSGSAGVVIPPAGYLQRLREICTQNNILLIFDEVITGFGRCGGWTGSEVFGVTPDILNFAKQVTNGAQPLGGCVASKDIYDTFMAAGGPEYMLEFAHGYTYSAHPVACAAGLAALDILQKEDLPARVKALAPTFEAAVHSLKGTKHVADIRNFGLAAGFTIAPLPGEPAKRPYEIAMAMWEKGFYVRYGADTIQLAPPFISTEAEIDRLVSALGDTLQATA
ncbi:MULTISPECIES: aspartate aminotransferase family protein [Comamonas]|jgi:beta-alanine--pyruvate transaminase|uniref:Aspartate aminotransferase family protein n=1 Tax=Comamonas terrigena TaxID=32013 RepID=A0A2A7UQU7_COMTR|nr:MULTISPECIES: aspartate aminotransferase family protein [Comamonas]MBD9532807.1 aspartate aminotransferase family protein [Comamonas sp. CMM01]MDH0048688.1 aspartate aminotransferase family protein [Comamonas terrigena]MDH0511668.1 aspartate aminotransferase family protein [Comamonas terrigena]MDH1090874.1 aspartate aminotransferase family protein [Comamonas terrigena]MDH1502353.1 aspartate aminotransferase family protein [Comamonas terrigena]